MARSVLLQLARDSIEEVLEGTRKIDKKMLCDQHPLLKQSVDADVKIFLKNKLRGFCNIQNQNNSLIQNIILNAKKAAFEDQNYKPLSTSEYLDCEIELTLKTSDGIMSEKDPSILSTTEYSLEKELNS